MRSDPGIIGAIVALTGFAVAVLAGLGAEVEPATVLLRALLAMGACYVVGLGVGGVLARVVREHVELHKRNNPIPESGVGAGVESPGEIVDNDKKS